MAESDGDLVAGLAPAIMAVRMQNKERARRLLRQLIRQSPDHERAWMWLAIASDDSRQAQACWRQVLRINPNNARARQALHETDKESVVLTPEWQDRGRLAQSGLSRQLPGESHRRPTARHLLRRWAGIWLLVAGLMVILGGFAAQAWVRGGGSLPLALGSPHATAVLTVDTPAPGGGTQPPGGVQPPGTATPTAAQRIANIVPELEQAWAQREWNEAFVILAQISSIDASYPGLDVAQCDTLLRWAEDEVARKAIQEAHTIYDQALEICEAGLNRQDQDAVQEEKSVAFAYLSGKWRHDHALWKEAVSMLEIVYQAEPEYADVRALLYAAYIGWAEESLAAGALERAREAGEAALALSSSLGQAEESRAQALLAEIQEQFAMQHRPPTPTPGPTAVPYNAASKLIEVNISQQRMYVWHGETLLYNWVCSTGGAGTGTAAGYFSVLNKIPEAWASTWSLRMPYWLGIYQVGSLQNGIHALPILPNGQILWAGYLGSRVSYGCIILSTENAQTLYNWADIGTPVWIHY